MAGKYECPFCARIEREEYDVSWLGGVSFEPLNPVTPGHRLFVSRQHESPLHNPYDYRYPERDPFYAPNGLGGVLPLFYQWRRETNKTEPFNLILNAGAEASQTIEHLHLHYIPRREDDGLMLPWTTINKEDES